MLSAERFLLLLNHYRILDRDTEVEATLEELAGLFHCTERNVKLIIRKLEDEGWITWHAGRGRGIRSRIEFCTSREQFLLDTAKLMASEGDYQKAFQLMQNHGDRTSARDRFVDFLNGHFGSDRLVDGLQAQRDIFRLPVYRPPVSLDPARLFFSFDSHLIHQIFDRLLGFDAREGKIVPALAHNWESSEDARVWTFHLRKGVKFHHGKEMTSEDVCFTLQRLADGQPNRFLLETMVAVTAIDSRTVRISLRQPNRLLPRLLCSAVASILPADLLQDDPERYWQLPSGTGPFRLNRWTAERMDLVVHEAYFQGRAYLDEVQIAVMPEDIPVETRQKWGQIMASDTRMAVRPEQSWGKIQTINHGCSLLSWNRRKSGPQQSVAFRQAIDLAIDRQGMSRMSGDHCYPARSYMPKTHQHPALERYEPDTAMRLLKESGYDGSPIKLLTGPMQLRDAKWIKERCAEIGVPVEIRCEQQQAVYSPDLVMEADCILLHLVFAEDEVCELEIYLQDSSYVRQHTDTALAVWVRRILDLLFSAETPEERRSLLRQIEQRLLDEHQVTTLIHRTISTYVHPSVRGIDINKLGWMDFKDIWLVSDTQESAVTSLSSPV
ncbi:DNA-binding transcriptional regulator SgrR of sgrS sRNA, contains a MarR-type HTH domain and a solute-binding domain [Paenibacillaceae bacterium GAS479]|nr:DNA-binding transcriptional regulator SgrR of sgrS sRNA, contains a MarR-type HTH domain and a solute-binding domain [Paenibacillaceae bacterium GAS479]